MDSTLRQLLQELFSATRELAEARRVIQELQKKLSPKEKASTEEITP